MTNYREQLAALAYIGGGISIYDWDGNLFKTVENYIRANAWRYGLTYLRAYSHGNGHFTFRVVPCAKGKPRTCAGTRGRGKALAKRKRSQRRANAQWINWIVKNKMSLSDPRVPKEIKMMSTRQRAKVKK